MIPAQHIVCPAAMTMTMNTCLRVLVGDNMPLLERGYVVCCADLASKPGIASRLRFAKKRKNMQALCLKLSTSASVARPPGPRQYRTVIMASLLTTIAMGAAAGAPPYNGWTVMSTNIVSSEHLKDPAVWVAGHMASWEDCLASCQVT